MKKLFIKYLEQFGGSVKIDNSAKVDFTPLGEALARLKSVFPLNTLGDKGLDELINKLDNILSGIDILPSKRLDNLIEEINALLDVKKENFVKLNLNQGLYGEIIQPPIQSSNTVDLTTKLNELKKQIIDEIMKINNNEKLNKQKLIENLNDIKTKIDAIKGKFQGLNDKIRFLDGKLAELEKYISEDSYLFDWVKMVNDRRFNK